MTAYKWLHYCTCGAKRNRLPTLAKDGSKTTLRLLHSVVSAIQNVLSPALLRCIGSRLGHNVTNK